ncbi:MULTISPECIES: hypothetical protein [unclassified Bradyrhizobium]|uniref:hypothetical protein n=1 Tax=unclassified Bradyrhizobium TaxID=2631580 RepID=UPI00339790E8
MNKPVSRLAANIPLIKRKLAPLSFADVPRQTYTEAVLGAYELKKIDLLRDAFIWRYERSAARCAAVRQSLGEPNPFRLRYREQFRELIAELVRARGGRRDVATRIAAWSEKEIVPDGREHFAEIAAAELIGPHEGNFARYRIRPSEFQPGDKSGRPDDRCRTVSQTAGGCDLRSHHRALSRHHLSRWEWTGEDAAVPALEHDGKVAREPVYRVCVRGTEDLRTRL